MNKRTDRVASGFCAAAGITICGAAASAQPIIVALDEARQGQQTVGLPASGATELTAAISSAFPGVSFRHQHELTSPGLAGADLVLLMATRGSTEAISPLSAAEQAALSLFVASGGAAFIVCDNDSFAGSGSDTVNESLADPFGVDVTGTGPSWPQGATVLDPSASVVTGGPFGTISNFSVGWSGWFDAFPTEARLLATLDANAAACLLELPPDVLTVGSGRVVLLGDSTLLGNSWLNDLAIGLVRNIVAAASGDCPADFNRDGVVNSQDFFDFLTCFFDAACPRADFNADEVVNSQDFFDFLAVFFAGC